MDFGFSLRSGDEEFRLPEAVGDSCPNIYDAGMGPSLCHLRPPGQ